jgi:hypothetical protein
MIAGCAALKRGSLLKDVVEELKVVADGIKAVKNMFAPTRQPWTLSTAG